MTVALYLLWMASVPPLPFEVQISALIGYRHNYDRSLGETEILAPVEFLMSENLAAPLLSAIALKIFIRVRLARSCVSPFNIVDMF